MLTEVKFLKSSQDSEAAFDGSSDASRGEGLTDAFALPLGGPAPCQGDLNKKTLSKTWVQHHTQRDPQERSTSLEALLITCRVGRTEEVLENFVIPA